MDWLSNSYLSNQISKELLFIESKNYFRLYKKNIYLKKLSHESKPYLGYTKKT